MAFQIPPQAFLSFSKKQAADSLWRLLRQMEEQSPQSHDRKLNEKAFKSYCETLLEHEVPELSSLAEQLTTKDISKERELEYAQIILERFLKKDLREDQFIISTQDTEEVKSGKTTRSTVLVLDNLRSAFNVGSLFRSAEAMGIKMIHLCGYTAGPDNSKTAKAALGTDSWVEYRHWDNTLECLEALKEDGFTLYALELTEKSQDLTEVNPDENCALILGNERYGLATPVLTRSDKLVSINLVGRKNSLNVAVCGAITMHHFQRN